MKILITAGNTQTPIDEVRVITNIFSGRTGSEIALTAHDRGHSVCLLTSHPERVSHRVTSAENPTVTWEVQPYRTFDDLQRLMQDCITGQNFDAIVHCAAVSDYQLEGTYAPADNATFDVDQLTWRTDPVEETNPPAATFIDIAAGKIKSSHRELWLRLVPTPKLIDSIRQPWGFKGILVKFKLEVGPTDEELLRIAEASRTHSHADLIVANTSEEMRRYAFIGPVNGQYQRLERGDLAESLLAQIERLTNSENSKD